MNNVPFKVLLPMKIWNLKESDPERFPKGVLWYMKRYPHYKVLKVVDGFAICEKKDTKMF
ncbi:hypothetical protein FZW96_11930 [Bacillus sp. BGMRC 2118]|nr:hypothetical protein FZW96_11930 [Bacillus sp. BGMRC 2118]